jgi:hypothetical protein
LAHALDARFRGYDTGKSVSRETLAPDSYQGDFSREQGLLFARTGRFLLVNRGVNRAPSLTLSAPARAA